MAEDDKYTANTRGARRYRFDEEARRKRLARDPSANPSLVPVLACVSAWAVLIVIYATFFR